MEVTKEIIGENGIKYQVILTINFADSYSVIANKRRVSLMISDKRKGERKYVPLIDHMEFTRGMGDEAGGKLLDEYRSLVPFDLDEVLNTMLKEVYKKFEEIITQPITSIFRY